MVYVQNDIAMSIDNDDDQPRPIQADVSIFRANSLPIGCQTNNTRATFPFKRDIVRQSQKKSNLIGSPKSDKGCNNAPNFQPGPQMKRRCASDVNVTNNEPPNWLIFGSTEMDTLFPIQTNPVDNGIDWWLKELRVLALQSSEVHISDNEVEVVENIVLNDEVDDTTQQQEEASVHDTTEEITSITIVTDNEGFPLQKLEADVHSPSNPNDLHLQQYSPQEMRILQEKMKDLRVEIEHSEEIDPDLKKVFQEVEGAIQGSQQQEIADDTLRRTTVGITGGTLTVVGVALIPFPIIPGSLVAYGGLLILASEFDSAKKALNIVKDPIDRWLSIDDDEEEIINPDISKANSAFWEEMISHNTEDTSSKRIDIDDAFSIMMGNDDIDVKNSDKSSSPDAIRKGKQFLRKVLLLDADTDEGTDGDTTDDSKSQRNTSSSTSSSRNVVGCNMLSFDFGEELNDNGLLSIPVDANEKKGNDINFQFQRFASEGSITLNTINNEGEDTMNIQFSRQSTSELQGGNDCLWVRFGGCNSFNQ